MQGPTIVKCHVLSQVPLLDHNSSAGAFSKRIRIRSPVLLLFMFFNAELFNTQALWIRQSFTRGLTARHSQTQGHPTDGERRRNQPNQQPNIEHLCSGELIANNKLRFESGSAPAICATRARTMQEIAFKRDGTDVIITKAK